MKKISLFFLLISSIIFAQNKVKVDLSSPNSVIYTHLFFLQPDSYEPEKAAQTIYGFEGEQAEDIAVKLKKILDGKGLKVDFSKVPKDRFYSDTTDYKVGNKYVLFPYRMPEVYVERVGGNWYYSSETTSQVNELYKSIYPWYTEKLQQIIPDFGHEKMFKIELWQYLGLLILLLICVGLFYLLKKIVYYILLKIQYWIINKSNDKIKLALKKLTRPIVFLLLIWFVKRELPSLLLPLDLNTILFLGLKYNGYYFLDLCILKISESIYGYLC